MGGKPGTPRETLGRMLRVAEAIPENIPQLSPAWSLGSSWPGRGRGVLASPREHVSKIGRSMMRMAAAVLGFVPLDYVRGLR